MRLYPLGLGLPLFTELPRRLILGNPDSYARIPIRYRGVGKRACSTSFLVEFFPESYWLCLERLRNFHAKAPKKITMRTTVLPHSTNVTLSEGWPKRTAIPAANTMKGSVQSTKTTISTGVVPFLFACILAVAEPDLS